MKTEILFLLILLAPFIFAEPQLVCYWTDNTTTTNLTTLNDSIQNTTQQNNSLNTIIDPCDISISINSDKDIYQPNEKITIYNNLSNSKNIFTIEYWIEDINNNIIKEKLNTTNTLSKQFTPKLNFSQYALLKNKLGYYNCSTFITKESQKQIYIFSDKRQEPSLFVRNITSSYNLNQTLNLKVDLYSGNITDLISISLLGSESTYQINSLYSNYNLTIPFKIPNDCTILSGINQITTKFNELVFYSQINLVNNINCSSTNTTLQNQTIENPILGSQNPISSIESIENEINDALNATNSILPITTDAIYESSSFKAKNLVIYGLAGVIVIFIICSFLPDRLTRKWYSLQEQS